MDIVTSKVLILKPQAKCFLSFSVFYSGFPQHRLHKFILQSFSSHVSYTLAGQVSALAADDVTLQFLVSVLGVGQTLTPLHRLQLGAGSGYCSAAEFKAHPRDEEATEEAADYCS